MDVLLALGCLSAILLLAQGIVLRDHTRSRESRRRTQKLGFFFDPMAKPPAGLAPGQAATLIPQGLGRFLEETEKIAELCLARVPAGEAKAASGRGNGGFLASLSATV